MKQINVALLVGSIRRNSMYAKLVKAAVRLAPGAIGTAIGQQHFRQVLAVPGAHVMAGEANIAFSRPDLISDQGEVTDASVTDFIRDYLAGFAQFAARFHG